MEKEVFRTMDGKNIIKTVTTVMVVVIMVVLSALIVGTFLGQSVFSELTIINTTSLSEAFGLFVTGLIAFLAIMGTVAGIAWLVSVIKPLFDRKSGLQGIAA